MLNKQEIEDYKTFKNSYQIEKDYLQDMLLYEIFSKRYMTGSFVFKGGTALSKFYYSSRFSEDLDFTFTESEFDFDVFSKDLAQIMSSFMYKSELSEKPTINKFGTVTTEAIIRGPRFSGKSSTLQHIRLEINTRSVLKYKPVPMVRNPRYKDIPQYIVLVMDSREILAEKVRALMSKKRRHKERDLYDIYFLFSKGINLDKKITKEKLNDSKMEFSKNALMENIDDIRETWGQLLPFIDQMSFEYAYVKSFVVNGLEKAGLL